MKARIEIEDQLYQIDFSKPISIAIPLGKDNNANCYFTNPVEFKPIKQMASLVVYKKEAR